MSSSCSKGNEQTAIYDFTNQKEILAFKIPLLYKITELKMPLFNI